MGTERKKLVQEFVKVTQIPDGTYALEIETEAENFWYETVLKNHEDETWKFKKKFFESWDPHRDGSLRNYALEFVSKRPWSFAELEWNVRLWSEESQQLGIRYIPEAPAASVHVHVNMLPETMETLVSFLTIWYLLEDHMAIFAGNGRKTNLFALPARAAQGVWWHVQQFSKSVTCGRLMVSQSHKYSALNLYPLTYQGSVEIRLLGGTVDPERIIKWVRMIDRIMKAARAAPAGFWMDVVPDDPELFVRRILHSDAFDNIQPQLILRNYLNIDINILSIIESQHLVTSLPLRQPKQTADVYADQLIESLTAQSMANSPVQPTVSVLTPEPTTGLYDDGEVIELDEF